MKKDQLTVTLLVSTYNWPEALEAVFLSILEQSSLPDEILIADDGSGYETARLINRYKKIFNVPVKHVWQEDKGFRKSTILNKAMKIASGKYIIQIDGDIIVHRRFIEDHIRFARHKRFVQGCRTILSDEKTQEAIVTKKSRFHFLSKGINNRLNAFRFPILSWLIPAKSASSKNTKACNLAFWKEDYVAVNGYNNHFHGWGWEDDEFAARLINFGIRRKRLKLAAICYHLEHDWHSREHNERNEAMYYETVKKKTSVSSNGLQQV